jgi:hypothetical protein
MNDRPDAKNLLATARDALAAEILPTLKGRARYTALMIVNAISIAEREIEAGAAPSRAEYERLQNLLRERSGSSSDEARYAELAGYNRRLAEEIRAGRFDGPERAALIEHLRRTTEEKLAVSNPKALK